MMFYFGEEEIDLERNTIIRCKDCAHCKIEDNRDNDLGIYGICELDQCDNGFMDDDLMFYCGLAKQRESYEEVKLWENWRMNNV